MSTDSRIHQPERVIVGNCKHCGRVVVVLNNHESWPYIDCECGEAFDTQGFINYHRVERIMPWDMPNRVAS